MMEKFKNWVSFNGLKMVASLAMLSVVLIENRVCFLHLYQDKLPESAKKLRKF